MSQVLTAETIERAIRLAGRAPSLHNSQPWRWVFDGSAVRLYSDRTRLLPSTDTSARQLLISCGATLGHLRVALAAAGWHTRVAYFPNPTRRDHLATVTPTPARIVTDADLELAAAIEQRRTDRLPFEPPADWPDFQIALHAGADANDTVLTVLPDAARSALSLASRINATLRHYDSAYQAELHWWSRHSYRSSGIPPTALVSREERERVVVGRTWPTVSGDSRRTEVRADRSAILVLSTATDSPSDLLHCGEALSTVLLKCTAAGYATCPLTHITEIPRSRTAVRELTARTELPQVLVRVGANPDTSPAPAATPRRPLSEILQTIKPEIRR